MLAVADIGVLDRPPLVTVRPSVIGEVEAVRAVVTRVSPKQRYLVRFRIGGATAGSGCAVSASVRVRAGSTRALRVALVPRGMWCPGVGVLSVVADRRGAATGAVRLRVRPAAALGQGVLVGRLVLGPTCPVERVDDPCDPVARPAPLTLVALDGSGGEAARTATLGDGSFALDLPAGSYTLRAERAGAFPSVADTRVRVTAQATRSRPQRVVVAGDTGIR